jgi:hypothetical protein
LEQLSTELVADAKQLRVLVRQPSNVLDRLAQPRLQSMRPASFGQRLRVQAAKGLCRPAHRPVHLQQHLRACTCRSKLGAYLVVATHGLGGKPLQQGGCMVLERGLLGASSFQPPIPFCQNLFVLASDTGQPCLTDVAASTLQDRTLLGCKLKLCRLRLCITGCGSRLPAVQVCSVRVHAMEEEEEEEGEVVNKRLGYCGLCPI